MTKPPPRISLITAVKNGAAFIERALDSVLSQDYPELDFIVMDGASTDGTVQILERYRRHLGHFESRQDQHHIEAYNRGLQVAKGDLIGIFNADDELAPGFLWAMADAALAAPRAMVYGGSAEVRDVESRRRRIVVEAPEDLVLTLRTALEGLTLFNAKLYRRELFHRYGFFEETLPGHRVFIATDRQFLIRLAIAGVPSVAIPAARYVYYAHAHSLTFNWRNVFQTLQEHLWIADYWLTQAANPQQRRCLTAWRIQQRLILGAHHFVRGEAKLGVSHFLGAVRSGPILAAQEAVTIGRRYLRNHL